MNTKLFFLLIASLLITNTTSSIVTSKKETGTTNVQTPTDNAKPGNDQISREEAPVTTDVHNNTDHAEKAPKPTEDGKHHNFHFSRITARRRRRLFFLFLSKLILTITHICCFIYCFMHVFH